MTAIFRRRAARAALSLLALTGLGACDAELLLPAADAPATAEAAGAKSNIVWRGENDYGYGFLVYASCANGGQGEALWASGQVHLQGLFGGNNPEHLRVHDQYVATFTGTAIGQTSQEIYDVTSRDISQSNEGYDADWALTSTEQVDHERIRLTSRTTGQVIDLMIAGRWVLTPTGVWVLDGWEATARC
jgi:hypothetical protein